MQKRVRGSRKKKLFSCLFMIGLIVFLIYAFASGDSNPDDYIHEDKTVVQTIPDGLTENEAYKIEAIQCFSLDCRQKNNARAYAKGQDPGASLLNEEGVAIMERAFADDNDEDLQSLLTKAEEKFSDAVKVSGGYHRAYANLALVKFSQGKEDLAVNYISKAIEIKKNVADYYCMRAFFRENETEDYEKDLKSAEVLEPFISKGRYFGILLANDTKTRQHKAYPLVRSLDREVEQSILSKYLLWLEFSPRTFLEHAAITNEMTASFIANRFLTLKNLLPKFIKDVTKKCYMEYSERNLFVAGDLQTADREVMYNDRCGRFLQFALADTVRMITHHNVVPSYTYAALYAPGASLGPHLDRQQCEFTLSLTHLQLPSDKPWDIQFGRKWLFNKDPSRGASVAEKMPPGDQIETVGLLEGDGLLMMGRHLVSWRDNALPEGHRTHNTFLHYVQSDWTGTLD